MRCLQSLLQYFKYKKMNGICSVVYKALFYQTISISIDKCCAPVQSGVQLYYFYSTWRKLFSPLSITKLRIVFGGLQPITEFMILCLVSAADQGPGTGTAALHTFPKKMLWVTENPIDPIERFMMLLCQLFIWQLTIKFFIF